MGNAARARVVEIFSRSFDPPAKSGQGGGQEGREGSGSANGRGNGRGGDEGFGCVWRLDGLRCQDRTYTANTLRQLWPAVAIASCTASDTEQVFKHGQVLNLATLIGQDYALEEATGELGRMWPHFTQQENNTFCGLCSLAMAMNSFSAAAEMERGAREGEKGKEGNGQGAGAADVLNERDIFSLCTTSADTDPQVGALANKANKCGLVLSELALVAESLGLSGELLFADEMDERVFFQRIRAALVDPSKRVLLNYHMTTMGQLTGSQKQQLDFCFGVFVVILNEL